MAAASKPRSSACDRNQGPILEVLRRHFIHVHHVLEIGSGTGQHAAHFAAALPALTWQTSDLAENLPGIRAWLSDAHRANLPLPLALDVNEPWPHLHFDGAFSANTLHIMSWPEVQKMFARLGEVLAADAMLAIYGPLNYRGQFTSPSNAAFDASLKQYSPHMGIRDFAAVDALAQSIDLELIEDCAMPANNRTLVWGRGRYAR